MSNYILPDKVYLDVAIDYLGLGAMDHLSAIRTVCLYSKQDQHLPIYFCTPTHGYEAHLEEDLVWVALTDDDPNVTEPPIYRSFSQTLAIKMPYQLSQPYLPDNDLWYFEVTHFETENTAFRAYDPLKKYNKTLFINTNNSYLLKEDILAFKNKMENKTSKETKRIDPNLKALALLAREYADEKTKYRNGNKVNASAFKDHLVKLSKDHEVSAHGLNSIDDSINILLKELDLKEIPKK
tara:strand:- start:370 stop:1083 length:714 start_codon:yes stop_codon:yes gene_type:complete